MRQEFEKLPEIAEILESEKAVFVGDGYRIRGNDRAEAYLDGALYAYQERQKKYSELEAMYIQQGLNMFEQQKRINDLEKEVEIRRQGASVMSWHREQILELCSDDGLMYETMIERIKELLK